MIRLLIFCTVAGGAVYAQQPAVSSVLNAASYTLPGLPGSAIAQGSIFVVFGTNLGPATLVQASVFPLPTDLAGTSVRVTVSGTAVTAIMLYTSATQVAAILPSSTTVGTGTLTVTYNGQTSAGAAIQVVRSSFGIFTRNQAGSGPAWVQHAGAPAAEAFNALNNAAAPGATVTIYGTGLGPGGDDRNPPGVLEISSDAEVLVGGRPARTTYRGRSPQYPGLDQINFVVPDDAPEGCYVPLAVRAGGVSSNFTAVSVARTGKVCSDPSGLSAADLQRVQAGGSFNIGAINLSRQRLNFEAPIIGRISIKNDSGTGTFFRLDQTSLFASRGSLSTGLGFAPLNVCTTFTFRGELASASPEDPVRPTPLDAGTSIAVKGPAGTKPLNRTAPGVYSGKLGGGIPGLPGTEPDFIQAGAYAVDNGAGGADVGGFSINFTLPEALVWSNQDAITTIRRTQPLTLTWTGGAGANTYVSITGLSSTGGQAAVGAGFVCLAEASRGTFTVPADILGVMPPSISVQGVPTGALLLSTVVQSRSTVRGLDYFAVNVADAAFKQVSVE